MRGGNHQTGTPPNPARLRHGSYEMDDEFEQQRDALAGESSVVEFEALCQVAEVLESVAWRGGRPHRCTAGGLVIRR
jgi:hypothetical protein